MLHCIESKQTGNPVLCFFIVIGNSCLRKWRTSWDRGKPLSDVTRRKCSLISALTFVYFFLLSLLLYFLLLLFSLFFYLLFPSSLSFSLKTPISVKKKSLRLQCKNNQHKNHSLFCQAEKQIGQNCFTGRKGKLTTHPNKAPRTL